MNKCKDCKFYDDGECRLMELNSGERVESKPDDTAIQIRVPDDHGLSVHFKVGPQFGCVKWECKS